MAPKQSRRTRPSRKWRGGCDALLDQIAPTEYTNRDGTLIPTRHPPPPRDGFGDRFGIIYVDFEAWTHPQFNAEWFRETARQDAVAESRASRSST